MFYLLFGRTSPCSDDGGEHDFVCFVGGSTSGNDGEVVELIVAESSDDFYELSGDRLRDVVWLYALVWRERLPPLEADDSSVFTTAQVTEGFKASRQARGRTERRVVG